MACSEKEEVDLSRDGWGAGGGAEGGHCGRCRWFVVFFLRVIFVDFLSCLKDWCHGDRWHDGGCHRLLSETTWTQEACQVNKSPSRERKNPSRQICCNVARSVTVVEAVGVAQAASGRAGRLKIISTIFYKSSLELVGWTPSPKCFAKLFHQVIELVGRRPSPKCFAKVL